MFRITVTYFPALGDDVLLKCTITEVGTCELMLVYFNPFFSGTKTENVYSPVYHTVTAKTIRIIGIKPSFLAFCCTLWPHEYLMSMGNLRASNRLHSGQ